MFFKPSVATHHYYFVHLLYRLQGVNTLVVVLASRAITLLSSLLEELQFCVQRLYCGLFQVHHL